MSTPQPRIALLIDADNAPAEKVDDILTELSTLGEISIRRIYGNWTKPHLNSWQTKLLDYALRPMQQFDYAKGKNATDMAMTVDAMELLYTERPDAFGIVSSDCDFTPLVMHLRAKGVQVFGFGAGQTPKAFVNACSRFLYLESLGQAEESGADDEVTTDAATTVLEAVCADDALDLNKNNSETVENKAQEAPKTIAIARILTPQLRQDTRLMNLLRSAVNALQDDSGWAQVSTLRTQIGNKASFDPRNYGYSNLKKLLIATDEFDFQNLDSPKIAVRRKQKIPAPSATTTKPLPVQPQKQPPPVAPEPLAQTPSLPTAPLTKTRSNKPLPAHLHALRCALWQLTAQRTCVADILLAVPELLTGQACSYSAVAARLRERGLITCSQGPLPLLQKYPASFAINLTKPPHTVTYLK